ncbi:F0F1 ATP synthase subunit gamma [Rhabdothermincola salaria]|uniref:F0F1 ATP synthase subunit gamma n=1 Tax=Rhabdothermincola salaria TaxID=2903142 RepID=UPI001E44DE8C|nr:F0F1 ATP synthase subunit gamma [Rhabdothermincola salaria]MCD9625046.1 F0F1 ATP synthase subunit gamma [Rhabdothermincola salaria]
MAGGQERILRRRIKSVESTKKITRAMELIAATRVVKAQDRAAASRPYAEEITAVILDLVRAGAARESTLLQSYDDARTSALVVITSDRGLCGAYNSTVIRNAEREILDRRADGLDYALYVVGKKAQSYFNYRGYKIEESFLGVTDQPDYEQARAIAEAVRQRFEAGEFREVDLVYWRFLSAGTQEPVIRRFLPLQVDDGGDADGEPTSDLEYEPNPTVILDELLPRYIESRIYSALLDASASEHAARQRAMKAATDNAEELKITLARVMNRARQDAITTEIMEIVGGAEALKGDKATSEELLPSLLNPAHIFPDHLDRLDQSVSGH